MSHVIERPLALVILDGWGIAPAGPANAISKAHTPFYDHICRRFPQTSLAAAGESVGLSAGAPGNAEVGHLNLGAGRAIPSDAVRIDHSVRSGEFDENKALNTAMSSAAERGAGVHLIGLISDGGVHSSMETLYALLRMAKRVEAENVFVHAILDGRDVPARTADVYVEALELKMSDIGVGCLASLCGRFFAMDNSGNWERTAGVYTMLVHADGERSREAESAVRRSFLRGISDEFIAPIVIETDEGEPVATIRDGDAVIFFNHRAEAMLQLTKSVSVNDGSTAKPNIDTVCMVEYDRGFGLLVAFEPEKNVTGLGTVLAANRVSNYRIAEECRFPHVTRIFNAGIDTAGWNEQHFQVVAANRSFQEAEPEMESFKVADKFLRALEADPAGLFVVNISAPAVSAEAGNLIRTVEAVQFADTCLGGIVEGILGTGGTAIVTSSNGSCEEVLDCSGRPGITSTANDVPFHLISENMLGVKLRKGALADVAPTILGILDVSKPCEMSGSDLRIN